MKFYHRRKKTQRLFFRTPSWFQSKFQMGKNSGKVFLNKISGLVKRGNDREKSWDKLKGGEKYE